MVRYRWRTLLKAALDASDVVRLVERFVGEWSADEVLALPQAARPTAPRTARAVVDHSVELARLHATFDGPAQTLAGLQEMLLFFTHAAVAIVRLTASQTSASATAHAE
ncbi:MAG TPA: hypothetical protein VFE23_15745 [Usitatibacter sp.]|jgi:hypothetical protein|nr:hypothetical protein [Usitatibacter sp.]